MITGSCVALITPMKSDGAIDNDALSHLIEWHIEQKTDALVVLGTTGESATLTDEERASLIKFITSEVKGRLPIIVGTGSNSTQKSVDLTMEAKSLGADTCLIVVPYYNKPSQNGLYQHFSTIAKSVSIPQILYNVPSRTVTDILPETIGRLMHYKNIIGIKEATGDIARATQIINIAKERGKVFAMYSGDDATACEFMLQGGHGVISVVANVAPGLFYEMCANALSKNKNKAQYVNDKLIDLCHALFVEANPIPVKWALHRMGKVDSGIRLPLTCMEKQFIGVVEAAMQKAEITF